MRAAIGKGADIYVLNGLVGGAIEDFLGHDLRPVLNALCQIERWQEQVGQAPCAVMLDTGMTRLGISTRELSVLLDKGPSLNLVLALSHLACADDPSAEKNSVQLQHFRHCVELLKPLYPGLRASLSSTAGIGLGDGYHFDLLRPGIGLYGASPDPNNAWPWLASVVELRLPVIQVRTLIQQATVGYGASQTVVGGSTLATVYGGYADGLMRSVAGRGFGYLAGVRVPLVGRVSMDYCVFDITDAVPCLVDDGQEWQIEILGPHQTVDEIALQSGTIGYEVLTSMGCRYQRRYV
ncbi:alanine racemase [Halioxenophilus aromaticivorans]|uniref:Alanine racemase n=1 Tax=Halioxenophilus aromaticivorans TaxID=1306992 RepID=A0AAV3U7D8_9ALTE